MSSHPPHTYFDWVYLIEDFKNATDNCNDILLYFRKGDFDYQKNIYNKLISQFWDAITDRLASSLKKYQEVLSVPSCSETVVIQSYYTFREECKYLVDILKSPFFLEEERCIMQKKMKEYFITIQKTLEKYALTVDKSGKILADFKNNRLMALICEEL